MKPARIALSIAFTAAYTASAQAVEIDAGADFSLSAFVNGTELDSTWQLDQQGRASGLSFSVLGKTGFRADVGEVSGGGDDLGFARRSFRGLAFDNAAGKNAQFTVFGGQVKSSDGEGGSSNVMGVRFQKQLKSGWTLGAAQVITPAKAGQDRAVSCLSLSRVRENKAAQTRSQLDFDFAASFGGAGVQAAWSRQTPQMRTHLTLREVTGGLTTAGNPGLASYRSGYDAGFSRRLMRPLSLSMGSARHGDGLGAVAGYDSASLNWSQPNRPSLGVFWQRSASSSNVGGFTARNSAQGTGFQLSHLIAGNSLTLRLDDVATQTFDAPGTDNTRRLSFGWSRLVGRDSLISLTKIWDTSTHADGTREKQGYGVLQLNHRLKNSWDLAAELDFQDKNGLAPGKSMAARFGMAIPLSNGNRLNLQYRTPVSSSGSLAWGSEPVLSIGYSHNFSFGKRPTLTPNGALAGAGVEMGRIMGRVFEDLNGNRKWDAGEPGMPGVKMVTVNDFEVVSAASGVFAIDGLAPGEQRVRMVVKTLPFEFTLTTNQAEVRVNVPPSGVATIDYPVQRTGRIKGLIFWDTNRNGKFDSDEKPAIGAVAKAEGTETVSLAGDTGEFMLDSMAPGEWKVFVDVSYLGEDVETTGSGPVMVKVEANGETGGILLGVVKKEREVEGGFVKSVE